MVDMLTGKVLALALLVVALVAGVSVAVPALDQPDRPPSRAPIVVGGDPDRDRPGAGARDRSPRDDRPGVATTRDADDDAETDDTDDTDDDGRDDDVSDSDDGVQVIRPRPGGGEVQDADDDDDTDTRDDLDDTDDDSDDGDD